jgi:hypothetical protein
MRVEVAVLEPLEHLVHQIGDVRAVGAHVGGRWACRVRDIDRTGSPEARGSIALEEAGVEVQVEDDAIGPAKAWVDRHRANVVHSSGIAGHGHLTIVLRVRQRVSRHDCRRVRVAHGVALNGDGTLDGAGADLSPELAEPGTGDASSVLQLGS